MNRFSVVLIFAFVLSFGLPLDGEVIQQQVDRIFEAYDKPGSPGCALGVIQDGNFIYRRAYGMASLELNIPLGTQSVFYMGSISKQFTAAAIVLAAEQGFLSLDDNVRKYLPELPDYGQAITVRQMLHHTSGFRDFLTLLYLSGRNEADHHSKEEMLDLIARQKGLNNVPGDQFIYSNTNYFLLGEIVQRATKKSLAEFAAANIFQPLGMTHTRFYDDRSLVLPNRVAAYAPANDGRFLVDWSTNYDIVGGGGLMSTVDDLLFWDRNFYQNKLGKGTLVKEMLNRGTLNNGKQISYALGLETGSYRGQPIVEHSGALFGYRTEILRFPEQKFTVVCLCNLSSVNDTNIARKVADVFLEKGLNAEATEETEASNGNGYPDPSRFAGKYLDERRHFVYSFAASGNTLMAWGAKLRRVAPNKFKDLGTGTITFNDSRGVMTATLEMDGDVFFAGNRSADLHLNGAELATYAGQYRSAELDSSYSLSVDGENLMLKCGWNPAMKLTPIARDEFDRGDQGTVRFDRDAKGRISGLTVSAVSARNLTFSKQ